MKRQGNLPDGVIDTILIANGIDVEPFHFRSPDESSIENQAVNRQRVVWLNNEGYLDQLRQKKERAVAAAAEKERQKLEAQQQKEAIRLAKEEEKRTKAAAQERKTREIEERRLKQAEDRRLQAEAREKAAQAKSEAAKKVRENEISCVFGQHIEVNLAIFGCEANFFYSKLTCLVYGTGC